MHIEHNYYIPDLELETIMGYAKNVVAVNMSFSLRTGPSSRTIRKN
jgi:hypothetical protein